MKDYSKIHIAVLLGGFSAERDVSLRSGAAAASALRSLGCQVDEVDVQSEKFVIPMGAEIAFIALHGTGGEDGVVQSILEKRGIPFTGSGSEASRLAFDKVSTKEVFRKVGLSTPSEVVVQRETWKDLKDQIELSFPRVVKPARQGSSIGVFIVREESEMEAALQAAFQSDDLVLIEEFIDGRELTVGILVEEALPVIEIRPKSGWYDYHNKYTKNATEYLIPAPIDGSLQKRVQKEALKAHYALGCRDLSRTDFRVDDRGNTHLLEVNTIPGMTETSLLPKAAAAAGISFPQVCFRLVEQALKRQVEVR
jgi:D-alanine-D-alanine ligase